VSITADYGFSARQPSYTPHQNEDLGVAPFENIEGHFGSAAADDTGRTMVPKRHDVLAVTRRRTNSAYG
jgi:hypothetical protein